MNKSIKFYIDELDCAKECEILRKTFIPKAGVEGVEFDILSHQMTIHYDPSQMDEKKLLQIVESIGMHATIWGKEETGKPILQTILCVISGVLILLGIFTTSSIHRLFTIGPEEGSLPLRTVLFFAGAIVVGGWAIAPRAWASLKRLTPDMHLLMSIAVIGAISLGQWFEGATVVFLFSVALLLEDWSVQRARRAIGSLLDLSPQNAHVITPDGLIEKEVREVDIGEMILVRPGERIPLDARVKNGASLVNQSSITGESIPVYKGPEELVYAGTLCEDGALQCEVMKKAEETVLAHIIQMVEEAKQRKAKSEQWVERFARVYTPIMLILAFIMAFLPPIFGVTWGESIYRALVLLVIACPCALVISTPVSVVSALTAAAREGVLVKGGVYLELAARIKAIAFDKTGTITRGHPEVQRIIPLNGHTENELMEIASALEQASDHPLARAVVRKAKELGLSPTPAHSFQIFQGMGAEGTIGNQRYWIGSHRFMHEKAQETADVHDLAVQLEDAGHSVIAIGDFNHVCGLISVADEPRPLAKDTLNALRRLGLDKQVMLTGDHAATARLLAEKVGIEEFYADLLPAEKVTAIGKLVDEYEHVAMIGDGVNDAPALAASPLGIAMGGAGSPAAFETADVVLMGDDLAQLPRLVRHARNTLSIIKQNIGFSLGLKALFFILAILGLSSLWMAIAADTGASLLVIFNALRLLSFHRIS